MNTLLSRYAMVCRMISQLLPEQVEVVLHDIRQDQIVAIEGNFSNRQVGDESLLREEDFALEQGEPDIIGPYSKTNWDGETLKSYSTVLRDEQGQPEGLLCVNMKTQSFRDMAKLLTSLTEVQSTQQPSSLFAQDWRESINQKVKAVLLERQITLLTAKKADRIAVLQSLHQAGLLDMRGATDFVAQMLGISRSGFYNLLKAVR